MQAEREFSNWSVEGMDAEYEPENWAKAINNTNFRKSFLYGINNSASSASETSAHCIMLQISCSISTTGEIK